MSVQIQKKLASSLLAAQLIRLSESGKTQQINPSDLEFIANVCRRNSRPISFSGVFINGSGLSIMPFNTAFSNSLRGDNRASPFQTAIAGVFKARDRILGFLALIDYLETVGELPRADGLAEHIQYITKRGKMTERAMLVSEYPEFRTAAAKSLPYDDSVILLDYFAHEPAAA
ncbi:MAG TPA: hypothetical protein VJU59_09145 [Paraburkholderia sp.]|uniref:hypothetical protein n=1 Tax=Paraburkholderia sp. TaxID=1926495 RepID=UPI002B48034B|nr:hypothetical protein [Paraburkholderia sp.]HKR39830.1 hypothetical protein [Paraburkholderia sp.]